MPPPSYNVTIRYRGSTGGDEAAHGTLLIGPGYAKFNPSAAENEYFWQARVEEIASVQVSKTPAAAKRKPGVSNAAAAAAAVKKAKLRVEQVGGQPPVVLVFETAAARDACACALGRHPRGTAREADVAAGMLETAGSGGSGGGGVVLDEASRLRARVLSRDPALRRLHEAVVLGDGCVAEEDFWTAPERRLLLEEERLAGQRLGMRSAHFSHELLAEHDAVTGTYRLNRQLISDIFRELPAVEEAFRLHVSERKMDEARFWSDFLSSSYFRTRERRGVKRDNTNNIFDQLAAQKRAEEQRRAGAAAAADAAAEAPADGSSVGTPKPSPAQARPAGAASCALEGEEVAAGRGQEGYGTRRPKDWVGMAANMASVDALHASEGEEIAARYNRHSSVVLGDMRQQAATAASTAGAAASATLAEAATGTQAVVLPDEVEAETAEAPPPAKRRRRSDAVGAAASTAVPVKRWYKYPALPNKAALRTVAPAWAAAGAGAAKGATAWLLRRHAEARAAAAAAQETRGQEATEDAVLRMRTMEVLRQFWRRHRGRVEAVDAAGAAAAAAAADGEDLSVGTLRALREEYVARRRTVERGAAAAAEKGEEEAAARLRGAAGACRNTYRLVHAALVADEARMGGGGGGLVAAAAGSDRRGWSSPPV